MTVRQPRAWLQVNGANVNILSCEVVKSRLAMASSFYAVMALDDPSNPGPQFWADAAPIPASIVATNGDGQSGTETLLMGTVDKVRIDWNKRTVIAEGSDKSYLFMDTRADQNFTNKTTSQVVSEFAAQHGFNLYVDGTTDMAGTTFDGQEYAHNADYENQWDVIQDMATRDGKVAFVVDNDFYYTDYGNIVGDTYQINYVPPTKQSYAEGNFVKLDTWRNVNLADINSTSATWNRSDKQAYVGTSGDNSDGTESSEGFDEKGFE